MKWAPNLKENYYKGFFFFEAYLAEEAGEVELAVWGVGEHGVGLQQVLHNNHHIRKIESCKTTRPCYL